MPPLPQNPAKKKKPLWLRILIWVGGIYLVLCLVLTLGVKGCAAANGGGKEGGDMMTTKAKMKTLETMIWLRKHGPGGAYPTQEEGLDVLVGKPQNDEEEEKNKKRLRDSWGRRFQYRIPGVHRKDSYDLWSNGPDGIEGTEDDITNWK
jgi:general secretion pathway protein G